MTRPTLIGVCLALAASCCAAQVPDSGELPDGERAGLPDPRTGWHFHLDPPAPPRKVVPRLPSAGDGEQAALARFRQLQKEVEERRALAVIQPTEPNVRRYMELEAKVVHNASRFADVAQRIAWSHPELDPATQGRPVNATALEVFEQARIRERNAVLAQVAREHVLMFFFRGDCGYCHAMAPVLRAFCDRHGMRLVPISVDGGALAGFPQARSDNGAVRALKVQQVPALFLAQPFSGRIEPVGFGVLSEAQLGERIVALFEGRDGKGTPPPVYWGDQR
ncbi:conjugal transfer protein TraF [Massilia sp. Root351]|jgi:conjugal transfer pilus assembly protein TraF|uniref:conjugal transfer protein TraF n=1 Tax=Massilia sp. Root351 TaxID=1736522 RepID=UPI0009EB5F6A|nr:conjugal transfer protein TraF [Massilia sp. Root351]